MRCGDSLASGSSRPFTESNQRRVILEADPRLQNSIESLKDYPARRLGRRL
ncbi:MAG: hypothetical protein H6924_09325 [Alphaproteobacteria bacterium]|nr:hypothetical protein [Alphaproteobacteria bacterium]